MALSREGGERWQRLEGWDLEPGTGLTCDPTTDRLLLTMLKGLVRQVSWLPPG